MKSVNLFIYLFYVLIEGICDFQYLPSKPTKLGVPVSTREELFPVIGKASDDIESLFVCNKLFHDGDRDVHVDLLPPVMSRVDRPVVNCYTMTRFM